MIHHGDRLEARVGTWGANIRDFNSQPGLAQITLQVKASYCSFLDLGFLDIPPQESLATFTPTSNAGGLLVEAITVVVSPPEEGESRVNIKALIKNSSGTAISRLVLESAIVGQNGRELDSTSVQAESPMMHSIALEDSFWGIKANRLQGARLRFSLKAYLLAGTKQATSSTAAEVNY